MPDFDGDCRIRDTVRGSKIRLDIQSQLHRKIDSFQNQYSYGARHHHSYNTDRVERDFPRHSPFVGSEDQRDSSQKVQEDCYLSGYITSRIRMKIRFFNGTSSNLGDWIDSVEDFFVQMDIPEELKSKIASYAMEGEAERRWQQLQRDRLMVGKSKIYSWEQMKHIMVEVFLPTTCLIKVPNGQQAGEIIHKNTNILATEICEDESNDVDVEENVEWKLAACSTNVPLESDIDKHDEQSMESANCSIKVTTSNTDKKNVVDDTEHLAEKERREMAVEVKQRKEMVVVKHLEADKFMLPTCSTNFLNQLNIHGTNVERLSRILIEEFDPGGKWKGKVKMGDGQGPVLHQVTLSPEISYIDYKKEKHLQVSLASNRIIVVCDFEVCLQKLYCAEKCRCASCQVGLNAFPLLTPQACVSDIVNGVDNKSTLVVRMADVSTYMTNMPMLVVLGDLSVGMSTSKGIQQLFNTSVSLMFIACKHTLCYVSSIELEFRPYVVNAHSKVVENKFCVLGNYELRNLSMSMLFGKFSKGSYEKSLYAVSKMDVVRSCHEYVNFRYSSFLFLFDPGGEFRPARTRSVKLMAEVMFNLPPPLIMCPSYVRYRVMASVITTLNEAWEMVERAKELQVIGDIQGSKIPNIVDKCREEILEHLLVDAHDHHKALSMFSFDNTVGEALKLFGCTLNELFHVIRRRDWKTYCRCLVDWPINLVAFNLLSFETVHDLKECEDRERDSSAYVHYVTNFVMFCGMIMVSFDPGGRRRIEPNTSDKRGQCLVVIHEVYCPVDILWVRNRYRNAGYSLGVKGDNYVHGAVKMVWTGYWDGWYTIQRWVIPRALVEDLRWHTDEENASFIFDPGGVQRLTAIGSFGRCGSLVCSRMVNLLKSQAKINARILFVYSFSYSTDLRYTQLYYSLWTTCVMRIWSAKIMAMISWRNMNEFSPYRKKLIMPALLAVSAPRSSDFHSVVSCASYRLPVCMLVIIMAPLQRGFSVVGDKDGLDLLAMHDSAIQHVDFGPFVHVSSVIQSCQLQVVQYNNIATEIFLALLMHLLYTPSKQDISQVVSNRKMISVSHLRLMSINSFHGSNDYNHRADVTARLPTTMHDNLTRGRVIHLEGWKGENNNDMKMKLIVRECIIDSCVINLCRKGQTLKFYKLVNGLDPPWRHIGELGDFRSARLLVVLGCACGQAFEVGGWRRCSTS